MAFVDSIYLLHVSVHVCSCVCVCARLCMHRCMCKGVYIHVKAKEAPLLLFPMCYIPCYLRQA